MRLVDADSPAKAQVLRSLTPALLDLMEGQGGAMADFATKHRPEPAERPSAEAKPFFDVNSWFPAPAPVSVEPFDLSDCHPAPAPTPAPPQRRPKARRGEEAVETIMDGVKALTAYLAVGEVGMSRRTLDRIPGLRRHIADEGGDLARAVEAAGLELAEPPALAESLPDPAPSPAPPPRPAAPKSEPDLASQTDVEVRKLVAAHAAALDAVQDATYRPQTPAQPRSTPIDNLARGCSEQTAEIAARRLASQFGDHGSTKFYYKVCGQVRRGERSCSDLFAAFEAAVQPGVLKPGAIFATTLKRLSGSCPVSPASGGRTSGRFPSVIGDVLASFRR
jgi:hypothetical protein